MTNRQDANNMIWESKQYDVFDILRFPLVVLVVYIHCTNGIPERPINWESISNAVKTGILLRIYISNIISSICVPTFFMISGYLFYKNQKEFNLTIYGNKIKRRIRSLAIPYFLWIMIYFTITTIIIIKEHNITSLTDGYRIVTNFFIENGAIRIFYDCVIVNNHQDNIPIGWLQDNSAPLLFTLWYIRDLIIVTFFSPFLFKALKILKKSFLFILGTMYVFNLWPYIHGISITSIFYFSLGIYLSSNFHFLNMFFFCYARIFVIIEILISFACLYLYSVDSPFFLYFIHLFSIIGVFIALYIAWIVINRGIKPINILRQSAFFIYAAHMIYINRYSTLLVIKILPWNNTICNIIKYLMIPLIIVQICIIIFCTLQKITPKTLSLLNGRR